MIPISLLYAGVAFIIVLGSLCLAFVSRDYRDRDLLSKPSVAIVWLTYILHLALTVTAAVQSTWQIEPIASILAASRLSSITDSVC